MREVWECVPQLCGKVVNSIIELIIENDLRESLLGKRSCVVASEQCCILYSSARLMQQCSTICNTGHDLN